MTESKVGNLTPYADETSGAGWRWFLIVCAVVAAVEVYQYLEWWNEPGSTLRAYFSAKG